VTDTVTESVAADDQAEPSLETPAVEQKLIDQLVEQARSKGLQLTGEGGLLQQLTKTVSSPGFRGESVSWFSGVTQGVQLRRGRLRVRQG